MHLGGDYGSSDAAEVSFDFEGAEAQDDGSNSAFTTRNLSLNTPPEH
jgi:hypothetical protein